MPKRTITIFHTKEAEKGNHKDHEDAAAIIECHYVWEDDFLDCVGLDEMYNIIEEYELEKVIDYKVLKK